MKKVEITTFESEIRRKILAEFENNRLVKKGGCDGCDVNKEMLDEIRAIIKGEVVCTECGGSGVVHFDEINRDGNVERGTGTRPCLCKSEV